MPSTKIISVLEYNYLSSLFFVPQGLEKLPPFNVNTHVICIMYITSLVSVISSMILVDSFNELNEEIILA